MTPTGAIRGAVAALVMAAGRVAVAAERETTGGWIGAMATGAATATTAPPCPDRPGAMSGELANRGGSLAAGISRVRDELPRTDAGSGPVAAASIGECVPTIRPDTTPAGPSARRS
jgi:hypothetical protein